MDLSAAKPGRPACTHESGARLRRGRDRVRQSGLPSLRARQHSLVARHLDPAGRRSLARLGADRVGDLARHSGLRRHAAGDRHHPGRRRLRRPARPARELAAAAIRDVGSGARARRPGARRADHHRASGAADIRVGNPARHLPSLPPGPDRQHGQSARAGRRDRGQFDDVAVGALGRPGARRASPFSPGAPGWRSPSMS